MDDPGHIASARAARGPHRAHAFSGARAPCYFLGHASPCSLWVAGALRLCSPRSPGLDGAALHGRGSIPRSAAVRRRRLGGPPTSRVTIKPRIKNEAVGRLKADSMSVVETAAIA